MVIGSMRQCGDAGLIKLREIAERLQPICPKLADLIGDTARSEWRRRIAEHGDNPREVPLLILDGLEWSNHELAAALRAAQSLRAIQRMDPQSLKLLDAITTAVTAYAANRLERMRC